MAMRTYLHSALVAVFTVLAINSGLAQKDPAKPKTPSASTKTSISPTDDAVVRKKDKAQHENWKKGDDAFPGKPRDMWSVGLHGGYFQISGDVASTLGYGFGVQVRKSLGYVMSIRVKYLNGTAYGLNYKPSTVSPGVMPPISTGGRNIVLEGLGYAPNSEFFYNYKTSYQDLTVQGIINLNNALFHKKQNKFSFFAGFGVGLDMYKTKYDALDANGNIYNFSAIPRYGDPGHSVGYKGRKEVRDALRNLLDGTYETEAEKYNSYNVELAGQTLRPIVSILAGVEFRLSPRVSLTLEHQGALTINDDLMDGKQWSEQGDFTRQMDVAHYTNVGLNFQLGSKKKRVEPLWFINPFSTPMGKIAENKKHMDELDSMLEDDDKDGVVNKLDKEPNTPADCPVDTRGVKLDSDGDGIANCEDKEPFSPPGYPIDPNGVAQVPKMLTEPEMKNIGDQRYAMKDDLKNCCEKKGGMNEWFLPMIHFDLNKSDIKVDFLPELKYVSVVMKKNPDMKIVVKGHTDVRNGDCYNEKLSYNRAKQAIEYLVSTYGIARDRFILQYGGETDNLVKDTSKEAGHYMNRRVEFSVAAAGDKAMNEPNCDNKGKATSSEKAGSAKEEGKPSGGKLDIKKYGKE